MLKKTLWTLVALAAAYCVLIIVVTPSNERDWNPDQEVLPFAEIKGDDIKIFNIRNIKYETTDKYEVRYYNKAFKLSELEKVWYMVEPFEGVPGSAHALLSFQFKNDQFVAISVEIRKEKGEEYSPWKGLFRQYELMYVIADERDVIKLRSNYRNDKVYLYPIKTSKEKAQAVFLDMIKRANKLYLEPEFYNTLTNTCTTNIAKHVNLITPGKVSLLSWRILLPANSDKLAYDLGMIDTDLLFVEVREAFNINKRAMKYGDDPDFSVKIREKLY